MFNHLKHQHQVKLQGQQVFRSLNYCEFVTMALLANLSRMRGRLYAKTAPATLLGQVQMVSVAAPHVQDRQLVGRGGKTIQKLPNQVQGRLSLLVVITVSPALSPLKPSLAVIQLFQY
nr:hypothetical protein [Rhodoferax sp.]